MNLRLLAVIAVVSTVACNRDSGGDGTEDGAISTSSGPMGDMSSSSSKDDLSTPQGASDLSVTAKLPDLSAPATLPDLSAPPDLSPPDTDPFDPASCTGPLLDLSSKMPAGASTAVLGPYTASYRERACTSFTGCGAWGPAAPSWGPSGSGSVWLKVTNSGIIVSVVDDNAGSAYGTPVYDLGMDCSFASSLWSCGEYYDTEVVNGANLMYFGGSGADFSGETIQVTGDVRATCARFYGDIQTTAVDASYTEYQLAFLLEYGPDQSCVPDNASACFGKNCGLVLNNCGEQTLCGSCSGAQSCGYDTPNVCGGGSSCGLPPCTDPTTCEDCCTPTDCGSGYTCTNNHCTTL
jgi:hypothetical protein